MTEKHSLSPAQMLFWTGQKLAGDAPLYNMAWRFDLHLELDAALFAQAFQDVAAASEAMRLQVFETGDGVYQQCGTIRDFPQTILLDQGELAAFIEVEVAKPFDLSESTYRTALVKVADGHWVWLVVQHHIACDAQSGAVLAQLVSDRYQALVDGVDQPVADQPSYFEAIAGLPEAAHAPEALGTFPYGAKRGANPASTRVEVDVDVAPLNEMAASEAFRLFTPDLSRYALYLTAYIAYLARVSGDQVIAVGTPSHNRMSDAHRATLGLFVEVLPIEVSVTDDDSFRTLHGKVKMALGRFLRLAKPGALAGYEGAGFSNVLNYIQAKFGRFAGAPMQVVWHHPGAHDAQHALRLHVTDFDGTGEARLAMDVNAAVLAETGAQHVAAHFAKLMSGALCDPDRALNTLPLSDNEELVTRGAVEPQMPSVLQSFLEQVQATPDRIAVSQGGIDLTYQELADRSASLAARLSANGACAGDAIVLHMARSVEYVVGVWGTLMIGAHFVPVSVANPAARAQDIAKRANAAVTVTDERRAEVFDAAGVPVLQCDVESGQSVEPVLPEADDTAYVIFTSGSTGTPKGVAVDHQGLSRYIRWTADEFGATEPADYPLFTSISFDLTITSVFAPLTTGGRLVVYPEAEDGRDMAVLDVIGDDRVDTVKLTPAHLSLLCENGQRVSRINTLVLGGENLSVGLCNRAKSVLGPVRILNEYGPTEAVVGCMIHEFAPDTDTGHSVPIGRPAAGVTISLRDEGLNVVPQAVVGEICIGGRLAQGYVGDDDLTSEKFVCVPERVYRSGDLGRMRPDGVIEYLGRADMQAKVGGVRVEPAEIETALLGLREVRAAFVGRPTRSRSETSCTRCGLAGDYPGVSFDERGQCHICSQFDAYKERAQAYFSTPAELSDKIAAAAVRKTGKYDAIMLLSGGKDSTYAAYRLAELTPNVLALTLDNGFISDEAKANIARVTKHLGWDQRFMQTDAMNAIFVDSLKRHSNVCNGCFKTVYTLALREAREEGVPAIVTGLSRGQFFETRLTPELFQQTNPSKDQLEHMVEDARRRYHAEDDAISGLLATTDIRDGKVLDEVEIIDLYRYIDVPVSEIYRYLEEHAPWQRPSDTGRSTNCLINDLGIYFHRKREGYHSYALPYSWDVRMGHKTREQAVQELNDDIDANRMEDMLAEIGFDDEVERSGLVAYVAVTDGTTEDQVWDGLKRAMPSDMLPKALVVLDQIPITSNGKVDTTRLPQPQFDGRPKGTAYVAPATAREQALAAIFQQVLGQMQIGLHDDFFDLGGDSLAAVKIAMSANEAGMALPATALFEHRTLATLAAYADQLSDVAPEDDEPLLDLDDADLASIGRALS